MLKNQQQDLLVDQNILILHSLRTIISDLDDQTYTATREPYYSSSLGAHTRHILDHYLMLLAGMESGEMNYDNRNRDPEIETCRDHAKATIGRIIDGLKQLPDTDTPVKAIINVSVDTNPQPQDSTLGRELVFLHGHTTHHHSLMALIMRLQDKTVSSDFGFAPSTLKHRSEQACAR
ncbi:DinB family protein [Porticoccus sp. GXU_MW_L64]